MLRRECTTKLIAEDIEVSTSEWKRPCHDLRYYIAKEFLQTEENYVTTLSTILKVNGIILCIKKEVLYIEHII